MSDVINRKPTLGHCEAEQVLTYVPCDSDNARDVDQQVERSRREHSGFPTPFRYCFHSPAVGVDKRDVILRVPTDTDADLSECQSVPPT